MGAMNDNRLIDGVIRDYLTALLAILVEGAKAVGKTRTCSNIAKTVYTLDKDAERELLTANPSVILSEKPPVLLDEWQFAPELRVAPHRASAIMRRTTNKNTGEAGRIPTYL
jgi:hypothetical protein